MLSQSHGGSALWVLLHQSFTEEMAHSTECSPQRNSSLFYLPVHLHKPFPEEPCIILCSQILLASSLGGQRVGLGEDLSQGLVFLL